MKRFFISLLITITAMQLSAQKIIVDKVEDNGDRYLITDKVYSGFPGIFIGMSSFHLKSSDTTAYAIEVQFGTSHTGGRTIATGRKLLLKLSDNSIITLENSTEIGSSDYEWERIGESILYYVFPSYYLTKEQLSKICENEVVKVRLEYDSGEYTIEENKRRKSKFSASIRNAYLNIQNAYKVEKDIYSDF